jgi:hypothetical protein
MDYYKGCESRISTLGDELIDYKLKVIDELKQMRQERIEILSELG